jgi:hypothetical protein
MSQIVKLRRSSTGGNRPTNSQLQLGELAINTTDGKLYFAKSGSLSASIEEVLTTNAQNTGSLNLSGSFNLLGTENITGSLNVTGSLKVLGNTSLTSLVVSGSDPVANVQAFVPSSTIYNAASFNTPDRVAAGIRFNWSGENWTIGAARGATTDVDGLVFSRNGNRQMLLDENNNLILSGSINLTGSFNINGTEYTSTTSGTSGSNGTNGSSGTSGSNGTNGSSGSNGTNGSSGTSGSNGTNGTSGSNGTNGSSGSSGSNGTNGTSGSNGTNGSSGTSGDSLFALTGSAWETTNNAKVNGDLTITGTLTAKQIHTSLVTSSVLYESGSTAFGNTFDDNHNFTGSVKITGSLYVNGAVVGTGKLDETTFNTYTGSNTSTFAGTSSFALTASYVANPFIVSGSTMKTTVTVAATTWSLNHGMNERYPSITVFDSDGYVVIPTGVRAIDSNNIEVYFSEAQTGTVIATLGGVGATGASGIGGYTETYTSATTWSVAHNLDIDYPGVTVWDSNRKIVLPSEVVSIDSNNLQIYFSIAQAGEVHIVRGGHQVEGAQDLSAVGTITPSADGLYNLGSSLKQFNNVYISGSLLVNGVPFSGNIDTGSFNSIGFNTSAGVSVGVGELAWNNTDGTLDLGMKGGNVVQQIGQEIFYEVRNETGIEIPNGTAVYANGVTAGSGRITAAPYVADGSIRENRFLGIATENISTGVNGFVTHFGYVRDLDTRGTTASSIAVGDETWAVGDILYVHPTVSGKLTKVKPQHEITVAIIITRHQSVGVLFVRPSSGGHLEDIHDILINTGSLTNGQVLSYNSTSGLWVNTNKLTGSYGIQGTLELNGDILGNGPLNTFTGSLRSEVNGIEAYTASLKGAIEVSGQNVNVLGMITAQQFNVTFVSSSVMYQSGSTKFGDSSDDIHEFTGSVNINGNLTHNATTASFAGLVGIRRTTPEFTLDVDGDIALNRFNKLQFTGGTVGDRARSYLAGNGNNDILVYGPSNNLIATFAHYTNLGIRTLAPDTTLHISGSDGIKIQAGGNGDTPGLSIINYTNQFVWAKFGAGLQGNGKGFATISNWDGSGLNEKVRVSGDGDFTCLIEFLDNNDKILNIMPPNRHFSSLLRRYNHYIVRVDSLRAALEYSPTKKTEISVRSKP